MNRIGKSKVESLVEGGAFLVDMRSPVAFRDGHLPGAVNLPLRNFLNSIMGMDKKRKIVIYSEAITDSDLRQGNSYAENLGFTNIFVADYQSLTAKPVEKKPAPKKRK